jgi:hypothetical protein
MKLICKQCKKDIDKTPSQAKRSTNHFCSRSCSVSFNNIGKNRKTARIRICETCHGEYSTIKGHRSLHFCQNCQIKTHNRPEFTKTLTIEYYFSRLSVKDKHPSWRASHIRLLNRMWNKNLRSLPCAACGYDKYVELAHRKAVSSFPLTATLGEVNSANNTVQLCPNCHWEFDNGLLTV